MNKLILLIGGLLLSQSAYAEGISGADTAWIMTATALVLFMTLPGLSLFRRLWCVPRTCSAC